MSKEKKAAPFQWDDAFLLDDQLTEDERMIRDTARAYAQEKLQPRVLQAYAAAFSTKWGSSVCLALPCQKNTAAPVQAMCPMALWPARLSVSIPVIVP